MKMQLLIITLFLILAANSDCSGSDNHGSIEKSRAIVLGGTITMHSEILNEDRRILVRLPKHYERSNHKYPVLYVLDAEYFFHQATSSVQFLSELGYIQVQPIPQMIVVGVVNTDRNRDYTPTYAPEQLSTLRFPTSGKADAFLRFLKSELFPLIDTNYRTEPFRIISGWSLGGLLTVHTYLYQPHLFSAYLAISPSLWWDDDLYVRKADSVLTYGHVTKKPMVVTLGALEGGDMGRSVRDGFVPLMKEKLKDRSAFAFVEIPEESHYYVPYKAFYEGLQSVFFDWVMPNEILDQGLAGIKTFYEDQSAKHGYQINIPESAYFRLASWYYNAGDRSTAVEIAKIYAERFPESSYAHYYLGIRAKQKGNLDVAKKSLQEAIELENALPEPDSERILNCQILLKDIEEAMQKK